MSRLTDYKDYISDKAEYEKHISQGYQRNIARERFLKLAEYENLEEQGRFEMLKKTHPKFHNLIYLLKNNGVTYAEAIDWVNEHGGFNSKY